MANLPARLLLRSRCAKSCVSRHAPMLEKRSSKDMRAVGPRVASSSQPDGLNARESESLRGAVRDNVRFSAATLRLGNTAEYRKRRAGRRIVRVTCLSRVVWGGCCRIADVEDYAQGGAVVRADARTHLPRLLMLR